MSERGKRFEGKSRTKQAYKDACNINKIIGKAARTGTISHINKYGASYGDFSGFDYDQAMIQAAAARSMFEELPAEVRREFHNSPQRFIDFVEACDRDGKNIAKELPALAEPGRQLPISSARAPSAPVSPEPKAPDKAAAEPPPEAP